MQILEAFRALRALDEDVFEVNADGINKLSDFMDSDDLDYGVEVIDPEANTAEDIQDSYVGKVILDCCVCHSKLYRDKEDVVLDETGELANVGEDCPYCFTPDGFKVIGEVAAYSDAPAEEEPADAEDSDDVEVEDEVEVEEEPKKEPVEEKFARHGDRDVNESISSGTAEGGFRDTAKRPGGHTNGSGTNFKALDGKKTRTVKAKDLKPGMVTDTGKITKVTDIGWHNGRPSVEVAYGGIGAGGSFASDRVAADRDYEVLDEGIFDKLKKKKKPDFYSKEEIEKRRKANEDRLQKEKEKKEEEERKRGAEIAADWARRDKMKRDAERDYKRSLSTSIKGDSPSNTGYRGVSYSGGDYYSEKLGEAFNKHRFDLSNATKKSPADVKVGDFVSHPLSDGDFVKVRKIKIEDEESDNPVYIFLGDSRLYNKDGSVKKYASTRETADSNEEVFVVRGAKNESLEDLSMTANNTKLDITEDETGKVTVSMGPADSVEGEEMIAPISDETVAEIEANTEEAEIENSEDVPVEEPTEEGAPEEEVDMEIEEVDDDTLGVHESYLRNVYGNVKSYKTTGVTIRGNEMIVEGKIKFDDNHVKKVNFVYEAFSTDGKGNVTFKGSNEIAKRRGSYTLSGMIKDNRLVLESLSYNYNTLNEGKTRRVRGTVRV